MKAKKIKIVMEDIRYVNGDKENCFKIRKITNTIDFEIGEYLDMNQVEDLIKYNENTTIEIVGKR